MPGDHYYDLDPEDQVRVSIVDYGLGKARDAVLEARSRLQELHASSGAVGSHTPKALELLGAVLEEIDAALAASAHR
jgi:hypothetical protein